VLLCGLHDYASALQANGGTAKPARKGKLRALAHLDQRAIHQPHHGNRTPRRANVLALAKLHSCSQSHPAGVRYTIQRARHTLDHAARPAGRGKQVVAHLPGAHSDAQSQRCSHGPLPLGREDSGHGRLEAHDVTRLRGFERPAARRAGVNMVHHQPGLSIGKLFRTISRNQSPEIGARAQYVIAAAYKLRGL